MAKGGKGGKGRKNRESERNKGISRAQQMKRFKEAQPLEGSEEESRLNEQLRGRSIRTSTMQQYKTAEKLFLEVSSYPINADILQLFIRALLSLEPKLNSNTISQYVTSVKTLSAIKGYPHLDSQDELLVKRALAGARKIRESAGVSAKEAPIISDEAVRAIVNLETTVGSVSDQLKVLTLMSIGIVSRLDETWNLRGKNVHIAQSTNQLGVIIDIWNPKTVDGRIQKTVECCAGTKGKACGTLWCVAHELKERKENLVADDLRIFPDIRRTTYARKLKDLLQQQYPTRYALLLISRNHEEPQILYPQQ